MQRPPAASCNTPIAAWALQTGIYLFIYFTKNSLVIMNSAQWVGY